MPGNHLIQYLDDFNKRDLYKQIPAVKISSAVIMTLARSTSPTTAKVFTLRIFQAPGSILLGGFTLVTNPGEYLAKTKLVCWAV
jgi:hypothetical protein